MGKKIGNHLESGIDIHFTLFMFRVRVRGGVRVRSGVRVSSEVRVRVRSGVWVKG